jgi:hypothetical protein
MANKAPTLNEQVFASRYANLTVTRFPEMEDQQGGLKRKVAPGLRYSFGGEVAGVTDSEGMGVIAGGSLRVDDELRERDWMYIEEYGDLYPPEKVLGRKERKAHREGNLDPQEAFLSTEEFLRERMKVTGDFHELPAVAPDASEVLQRVTELAIDRDVDGLVKLVEDEQGEWNRPQVIEAVKRAVAQIGDEPPEAA